MGSLSTIGLVLLAILTVAQLFRGWSYFIPAQESDGVDAIIQQWQQEDYQ